MDVDGVDDECVGCGWYMWM